MISLSHSRPDLEKEGVVAIMLHRRVHVSMPKIPTITSTPSALITQLQVYRA